MFNWKISIFLIIFTFQISFTSETNLFYNAILNLNVESIEKYLIDNANILKKFDPFESTFFGKIECLPIHVAISTQNLCIIDLLMKYGANCESKDSQERYPIHHAIATGNLDVVKHLVEKYSVNIDEDSRSCIAFCERYKNEIMVGEKKFLGSSISIKTNEINIIKEYFEKRLEYRNILKLSFENKVDMPLELQKLICTFLT